MTYEDLERRIKLMQQHDHPDLTEAIRDLTTNVSKMQSQMAVLVDNLLDGKRTKWYKNGELAEEISYRNGQRHGKMISWNEDGTKKLEIEYQDGQPVTKKSDSSSGA